MAMHVFTPHDDLFLLIMKHPHIAKDALRAYLPKDVVKKIDWKSLKLHRSDTRSIDGKQRKTIADLLFLASDKKNNPVFLLLHVEHFSSLPREAILRTVHYQVSALLDYMRAHPNELLPSPISLIYYHGSQSTKNQPKQMGDLFASKDFLTYFANPVFHNITEIPDNELKKHGSMSGFDLLYKYASSPSKLSIDRLHEIYAIFSAEDSQIKQYVLIYSYQCSDEDPALIKKRH